MPRSNREQLTDKRIRAARANSKLYDSVVPGLVLRVRGNGRRTFAVWYRDAANKPIWMTVTDPDLRANQNQYPELTLDRARELARALLDRQAGGVDLVAARTEAAEAAARTVRALGILFVNQWCKARGLESWKDSERYIRIQLAPLLDRPVASLTRREIRAVIDALTARGVPVLANRVLAVIRKMLYFAVDRDWILVNPIAHATQNRERSRKRVLEDPEIVRYWSWLAAPPADADAKRRSVWPLLAGWCKLRLVLLVRSNEVLKMQWTDLHGVFADDADADRARPIWLLKDTKNGSEHLLPLSPLALSILTGIRNVQTRPSPYVFAGILAARDRAHMFRGSGLDDHADGFQLRDARRSAATALGMLKASQEMIARILNHTLKGDVTAIYNRWAYEPEKRDVLDRWGAYLSALVSPLRLVAGADRARG